MRKALVIVACFALFSIQACVHAAVPTTEGFADVVKKVAPSVVSIQVSGASVVKKTPRHAPPAPPEGAPEVPGMPSVPEQPPSPRGGSAGSGVVIDSRGYIVTNNHVVEGATALTVVLSDKREFAAKIVGTDPKADLAVVKIDAGSVPAISWGKYENLQVGDWVLAVGSPFGLSSTVTLGIISALGRGNVGIADYEDFIQTDAAINPGNSGGALVNVKGELVGINTAILSRTGGSEGVGFAVPASIADDVVKDLIAYGKVTRGWLGIAIQEVTPALAKSFSIPAGQKGVLVSDVNEKGPSASVLKRGDVVVEYDGRPVASVAELRNHVARTKPGAAVSIAVMRAGKTVVLKLTINPRPSDEELRAESVPGMESNPKAEMPQLNNVLAGVSVQDLTPDVREKLSLSARIHGVVVAEVLEGSVAATSGIMRGDVILEVDNVTVKNLAEYLGVAKRIGEKESVRLYLYRRGNGLYVLVTP